MAEERRPHVYSVSEARELVPRLRPLLNEIRDMRQEAAALTGKLDKIAPETRGNGHAPEVARLEGRIAQCVEGIRERLDQLSQLDIEVKDLDIGLVDFLGLRDGRIIYLCWAVDEPTVAYWHELSDGYRGRQPLDE